MATAFPMKAKTATMTGGTTHLTVSAQRVRKVQLALLALLAQLARPALSVRSARLVLTVRWAPSALLAPSVRSAHKVSLA